MGGKGKIDRSKQGEAEDFVNGWVGSSQRLRSIAILIVLIVIGFTFLLSFLTDYKYFPKQPSSTDVQLARIKKDISNFHFRYPRN